METLLPRRTLFPRGIGALTVIGVSVLVILFLLSMASSFFTAGVSNISSQVTFGDKGVLIARAAVAEVLAIIEASAKMSDNKIYYYLRLPLTPSYNGTLMFENDIEVQPAKVWEMVDGDESVRYVTVKAWIPWQLRLYRYLPYEKYGRLHIMAEVGIQPGAGYKQVVRRIETVYEFKVAAPLPPKPFDSVTALAMTMKSSMQLDDQRYRKLQKDIDDALKDAEDDADLDSGELGRPFRNNPPDNIYRAYPVYKYPPFPLNTRSVQGPFSSQDSDMDNPIFARESPFRVKKIKLTWPEDLMDQIRLSVTYVMQGGSIRVYEGSEGTSSFQPGEVITLRMSGTSSVSASLNNNSSAVNYSQRQGYDSQGQPVTDIDIMLSGTLNPGYANDFVSITGGGLSNCQILYRGQRVHSLDAQVQGELRRLETGIQTTLDDYGFTFRPIAEEYVEQFRGELAIQLSWEGYVTRATRKFDRAVDFKSYIVEGGRWELDGIYLVKAPLTVDASYTGNGVIVTRGGPVTVLRADALDIDNDTLTIINTDDNVILGGANEIDASLLTPRGTVKGLKGRTIYGNVIVNYFESALYNETPAGQVRFNSRLRRSKTGTGDVICERYMFYLNRQPLFEDIKRKE